MNKTVLVVDDDEDVRQSLRELLEEEGYATLGARDGAEALAVLRGDELPCMILLDLMMPVMDGWAFLKARAREPQLQRICTAVMTANAAASHPEGAQHFVPKPIAIPGLLRLVEECCAERAAAT